MEKITNFCCDLIIIAFALLLVLIIVFLAVGFTVGMIQLLNSGGVC